MVRKIFLFDERGLIKMESFIFMSLKLFPVYHDSETLAGCIDESNTFLECSRCTDKNICSQYNKINQH